jgi:hypothetical protein
MTRPCERPAYKASSHSVQMCSICNPVSARQPYKACVQMCSI